MRGLRTGNQAAVAAARDRGIAPRGFFWIEPRSLDTDLIVSGFGLWTGDEVVDVSVIDGQTGGTVTRTYVGGVNLMIGDIPRVADLTVQTVEVQFSALAPICQEIVRGHNVRFAKVELHAGWLDPDSRAMADIGEIDFLGEVDGAPIDTGKAGDESMVKLRIASDAILMLTRTNPRKRSYEAQKTRFGDEFALYGNSVATWQIYWGQANPTQSVGGK